MPEGPNSSSDEALIRAKLPCLRIDTPFGVWNLAKARHWEAGEGWRREASGARDILRARENAGGI
jgi:hypothetical protein